MLSKKIVKHIAQLHQKKYRKEFQEFLVEGVKGVEEAIKSDAEVVLVIIEGIRRDESELAQIVALAEENDIAVEFCGRNDVEGLQTTETFPGVMAVIGQEDIEIEDLTEGSIVCLDQVKDPGNLGTIIRTADWFGIKNILLSEECVDVYNPKVVRSTMGSIFHVNVLRSNNLVKSLEKLKSEFGYEVSALDIKGESVEKMKSKKKEIYLFGSESHGLSEKLEELIDNRYTILGKGDAESLNLAISVGVLMSRL